MKDAPRFTSFAPSPDDFTMTDIAGTAAPAAEGSRERPATDDEPANCRSESSFGRPALFGRSLPRGLRLAGIALTGVVLGGWCLWLGVRAASQGAQSQAAGSLPLEAADAPLELAAPEPRRLVARITEIISAQDPSEDVIHAVVNDDAQWDRAIAVANFTPTPAASSSERDGGVWLTGTIEPLESLADAPPPLAAVPAWKRTTQSLRVNVATEPRTK
jgi:hypothetical protein